MTRTMAEIRAANRAAGYYFFERDTMRFFDSRIETRGNAIGGRFFITSEQFHGSNNFHGPRLFTVREAKPSGDIDTVGKFQAYTTIEAARAAARARI